MKRIAYRLQISSHDVRVTRTHRARPRVPAWCCRAQRFTHTLLERLQRRLPWCADVETTLRYVTPNTVLQLLRQQNRFELAPRLTLAVCPERRITQLEKQIETRLLWQPSRARTESSPAERIVRLATTCIERQQRSAAGGRRDSASGSLNHSIRAIESIPRRSLALDMVVQRPQPLAERSASHAPEVVATERPRATEHSLASNSGTTLPPLDGSYLRRLTESVVNALDRRTTAAYERTGRRFV